MFMVSARIFCIETHYDYLLVFNNRLHKKKDKPLRLKSTWFCRPSNNDNKSIRFLSSIKKL